MIYFDNAATSWPKPPGVAEAMTHYLTDIGASPGRSGHRLAIEAARVVYAAREAVAELFGASDPLRVVFGSNVTEALNLALNGLLQPGDHVITGSLEHNSVMRPLREAEREGIELEVVPCSPTGEISPDDAARAIKKNTKALFVTHASNVTGTILPVGDLAAMARERGVITCVDAAQTAGSVPIDVDRDAIDILFFTGHKSLYGPMVRADSSSAPRVDMRRLAPLKRGHRQPLGRENSPNSCRTCARAARPTSAWRAWPPACAGCWRRGGNHPQPQVALTRQLRPG